MKNVLMKWNAYVNSTIINLIINQNFFLSLGLYPRSPFLASPVFCLRLIDAPPPFLFLILGASSTKRVSRLIASGRRKYLRLLPLIVKWSSALVSYPLTWTLTAFKWTFIDISTDTRVPVTIVPFLSSIVTV